jgi:hypothetical protein
MMPHPTTMSFAWEEEVLRCSRVLLCVFVFAVVALTGGAVLIDRVQHPTPVVAAERVAPAFAPIGYASE